MTSETDILRSAQGMIDGYGDGAIRRAARKANALYDAGDMAGSVHWLRIAEAIRLLQTTAPASGEARH